jgi:branched-chain amino acid aminotransferase
MKKHILYNGQLVDSDAPILSANSRSYRYGDGFFESMRLIDGRLHFASRHLARIEKSILLLHFSQPVGFVLGDFETWIESQCANLKVQNARIRCTFFREGQGFYLPEESETHSILEIIPTDLVGYPLNVVGLALGNFKELTKNSNYLSVLKTTSSLIYVMAGIHAREKSYDELVLYNEMGRVCEGISANIFGVTGEFIITPPISEFCIDGVMRRVVIELAQEYGYVVIERPLGEVELSSCREIFFTNASKGIQWVGDFMGKRLSNTTSRVLSERLNGRE